MADPTQDLSANQSQGGLFGMDPQMLMNLGFGLMSAAKPYGNLGDSLSGAVQNYQRQKESTLQQRLGQQQLGMNQVQLKLLQARLPVMQKFFDGLGGLMGDPQPQGAAGAQPQSQGPMGAPQGAPQGPIAAGVPQMQGPMGGPPAAVAAPAGLFSGGGAGPQGMPPQGAPQSAPQMPMGGQPPGMSSNPMAWARMGTLGAMAGMPGGQEAMEYGKFLAQNDPAMATRMEAAKSAIAVDQQMIQQARAQGNEALAQSIINGKLREDLGIFKVSSMGGMQTWIDANGVTHTLNPSTGIETAGNQASLMPGMSTALQQKSAAEAQGEATGKLTELTDDAQGSHTGTPYAKYPAPVSTITGGGAGRAAGAAPLRTPVTPSPGSATPAAARGPMSELGPGTTTMLKGTAEQAVEANKEYQTQAEAGQQMLVQTQELRDAAHDFSPGQFADTRMKYLQYLNSSGLISPQQMQSLGSAQAGQKIAIQLQAAATKQLGSREAAQIFTYMGKSLPNLTLSQNGLDKVSGYMDGIARYNMARAQVAQQRGAANDANGVNNVRNEFIQNTNPLYFVLASSPAPIQKEIVQSMGKQAPKFAADWSKAIKSGWAPTPSQYLGNTQQ